MSIREIPECVVEGVEVINEMRDVESEFKSEYEPTPLSRSLIALDPAISTAQCEEKIKKIKKNAQVALSGDIKGIRSLFENKRSILRRNYEESLRMIDRAEVVAVEDYFENMFGQSQTWFSRTGSLVRWLLGYHKPKSITN